MLQLLKGLLDKAQAQLGADHAEALLSARLAPDMFPLATQLRFAAVQAQEAPLRILGQPRPPALDELLDEGRNAGDHPGSIAEAKARIDQALAFLTPSAPTRSIRLRGPADGSRPAQRNVRPHRSRPIRPDWALGQFYFHVMAAYAILRKEGVEIGKADYVPHMFGYLRAEAA